jgi:hypothetical protein
VPVTGDDWYQRRRDDREGAYYRAVTRQGPLKGAGGTTRQGVYCFTASGKLLTYQNGGDAKVMLEVLRLALVRWKALPAAQRRPGAFKVPARGKVDPNYTRTPPPGGLVLNVFTRILDEDGKGGYVKGTCDAGFGDQAARDHLWLTKAEWEGLVKADAKKGQAFPMPAPLAERLLRFHMLDNTRGEPIYWGKDEVRKQALTWTVEEADARVVRLKLTGSALLATAADPARANRGFDLHVLGHLHYDRARQAITRFDVVAVGEHWGNGPFTRPPRPGRKPLGLAFELSPGRSAGDLVPPQAARMNDEYFGRRP